jgi:hypothetical protein
MLRNLTPANDRNKCWFCKDNNFSSKMTCRCGAATTATYFNDKEIVYRIYSFGCNSMYFPSSQRLHENMFGLVIQELVDDVPVAVRAGSDSQFTILIKDADGTLRSSAKTAGSSPPQKIENAEFLRVSRDILESHADKTAGKVSPTT